MAHANGLSAPVAFYVLPIEINRLIAVFIDDNRSLTAFRLVCRLTNAAVDGDALCFWRAKFRKTYDLPAGHTNMQLRQIYQHRAILLRRGMAFNYFRGHSRFEIVIVKMLRNLIVESYHGPNKVDEQGRPLANNHYHLINFIRESRLFNFDRRTPPPSEDEPAHVRDTLAAVKLMCFHFILDLPPLAFNFLEFDESQYALYQPIINAPLYTTDYGEVNLEWMLHGMNFFRHHMMNEEFQSLYYSFKALDASQKPSVWREPLRNGPQPLSRYWRGTYGYLHDDEIARLRRQGPGNEWLVDRNMDEGKLQFLELSFAVNNRLVTGKKLSWPSYYEEMLHSVLPFVKDSSFTATTGATVDLDNIKTDSFLFEGTGTDLGDDFVALGWLNPLPSQGDIPGWQRFTMMKAFKDDYKNHQIDNLWAYEGVVLPGNRIIMGRWWFASAHQSARGDYIGPFILWAVEEPKIEKKPKTEDESDMDSDSETDTEPEMEITPVLEY